MFYSFVIKNASDILLRSNSNHIVLNNIRKCKNLPFCVNFSSHQQKISASIKKGPCTNSFSKTARRRIVESTDLKQTDVKQRL